MKPATPQQLVTHLACMTTCVILLMLFVVGWFPDVVQSLFLINLGIGMHRLREEFAHRKVDLSVQCQTLPLAAKLCVLSTLWWISETLVKLQDPPKED